MLRIHRKSNGEIIFTLSGRIDKDSIAELEALIAAEGKDRRIVLDLKDMTLTGQDGISFLAQCETAGIALVNCDPYVREWITGQNKWKLAHAGLIRGKRGTIRIHKGECYDYFRFDRVQSEIPGIADRRGEDCTGGLRCPDPGRNGHRKRSDCESHS